MPPRSPLPPRDGLNAAWMRTPDSGVAVSWVTIEDWLISRIPDHVDVSGMLRDRRFVYDDGAAVTPGDAYRPNTFVWFHRDLPEEVSVPGKIQIVHRDDRIIVVDKPPFLSTIPRGRHVRESVVVRLRDELGLPDLTPVHRLDRVTSGLLVLATEKHWRGPYQTLFQDRRVRKVYRALAPLREDLEFPLTISNHIRKERGIWQAEIVPDTPPNAKTLIELVGTANGLGEYRLLPHTGKTHQLRLHMHSLGIPIIGDPLYPEIHDIEHDDLSSPLQLLAAELVFTDPVDGLQRHFNSLRTVPVAG